METIETNDGTAGGVLQGPSHAESGIKAIVITDNDKPVELEGSEAIINKHAVNAPGVNVYVGTNREVLSEINQSAGNGVPILKKGGEVGSEEMTTVSYRSNSKSNNWKRGYIKSIWSEKRPVPDILKYELYDSEKKLYKTLTPDEAEKMLANNLIAKGQNLESGGEVQPQEKSFLKESKIVRHTIIDKDKANQLSEEKRLKLIDLINRYEKSGYIDSTLVLPDQWARTTESQRKKQSQITLEVFKIEDEIKDLLKTDKQLKREEYNSELRDLSGRRNQLNRRISDLETIFPQKINSPRENRTKTDYLENKKELEYVNSRIIFLEEELSKMQTGGEIQSNQSEQKNKYSGYDYTNPEELERAKSVDLLTLPALVSGTNCSNCLWYSNNFCTNEKIKLPVNYRQCCALWDNSDALRSWEINSPNKNDMENTNSDEILKGGRADGKAIWDIAIKFNVPIEYAMEQLDKGLEEEKEHTPDFKTRYEIALDHLYDDIEYYNKLKSIEGMARGGKITHGQIEKDTDLLPEIIAQVPAEKFSEAKLRSKYGQLTQAHDEEYKDEVRDFENYLVARAEFHYQNQPQFKKHVRASGNKGRDYLIMFMNHWAAIGSDNKSSWKSAERSKKEWLEAYNKGVIAEEPDYLLNFDEYISKHGISKSKEALAKKTYLQSIKEAAEKNLYQQEILQGEISAIKAQNILEEAGLHVPEEIREATAEEVEEIAEELDEIKEKRMKEAQEFENFKKQAIIAEPMTKETTKAEVLESLEALKVSYDLSSGKEKELIGEAIEAMQVMYDNMPDVLCCGGYVLKQDGETITETYN